MIKSPKILGGGGPRGGSNPDVVQPKHRYIQVWTRYQVSVFSSANPDSLPLCEDATRRTSRPGCVKSWHWRIRIPRGRHPLEWKAHGGSSNQGEKLSLCVRATARQRWRNQFNESITFPYPHTLVSSTSCQQCSAACPSCAFHFVLVTLQRGCWLKLSTWKHLVHDSCSRI